jgi:multicomponent Na+:H+ antiporter subunit D
MFDISRTLIIGALLLPWVSLSLAGSARLAPWIRRSLPAAPSICLALALFPTAGHIEVPGLLLGSQFGVDDVNRVFVAITALAWLAAAVLAVPFVRETDRPMRFLTCFLLAMAGNFTLVLSQDAISFFTGFAVMSLAAYGLVNHRGDAASTYAGRVYIVLAIAGELVLFAGLLGLAHGAVDLRFPLAFDTPPPDWTITCVVLGFGVKAGLLGVHMSIPMSYSAAPLPAGLALAGAMLNAGLLGWLRWLPMGSLELQTWGNFFIVAGLFGAGAGVLLGLLQRAPRALLGYSSISQVGLMMLFIGAGIRAPDQWPLVLPLLIYFVLHHALAKSALFCASSGRIPEFGPRWAWWFTFSLPALALVGIPFSSGYFAKAGLKEALDSAGPNVTWYLTLATVGTALLMARWLYLVMHTQSHKSSAIAPWIALVLAIVVLAGPLLTLFIPGVTLPATGDDALTGAWPIVLAAALAGVVWFYTPGFLTTLVGRAPIGDIARIPGLLAGLFTRPRAPHKVEVSEPPGKMHP